MLARTTRRSTRLLDIVFAGLLVTVVGACGCSKPVNFAIKLPANATLIVTTEQATDVRLHNGTHKTDRIVIEQALQIVQGGRIPADRVELRGRIRRVFFEERTADRHTKWDSSKGQPPPDSAEMYAALVGIRFSARLPNLCKRNRGTRSVAT